MDWGIKLDNDFHLDQGLCCTFLVDQIFFSCMLVDAMVFIYGDGFQYGDMLIIQFPWEKKRVKNKLE